MNQTIGKMVGDFPRDIHISLNYLAARVKHKPENRTTITTFVRALADQDQGTIDTILSQEWHKPNHGLQDLLKPCRDAVQREQQEYARSKDPEYDHTSKLLIWADALMRPVS